MFDFDDYNEPEGDFGKVMFGCAPLIFWFAFKVLPVVFVLAGIIYLVYRLST